MAIGRPWLTLAIDVYSRAIAGMYLSLDAPGTHSVGLCLAQAILPKDIWLAELKIERPWPVSGLMKVVHADNGPEFHTQTLKLACKEWGIDLRWRPVKRPHYGGHIERLLGTVARELHEMPGDDVESEGSQRLRCRARRGCWAPRKLREQFLS